MSQDDEPGGERHLLRRDGKALRIRIATWNHNGRLPVGDLNEFLGSQGEIEGDYDLVIVGGQECPTGTNHRDGTRKWSDILKDHYCGVRESVDMSALGKDYFSDDLTDDEYSRKASRSCTRFVRRGLYKPVAKERLMGIYLAVLCRKSLIRAIKNVRTDVVRTGALKGNVGNKGAVGIALEINGIKLLFLCVHLAPHQLMTRSRIKNISKILKKIRVRADHGPDRSPSQTYGFSQFPQSRASAAVTDSQDESDSSGPSDDDDSSDDSLKQEVVDSSKLRVMNDFDDIFLFGDLNFRIDLPKEYVETQIAEKKYTNLIKKDQLRMLLDADARDVFKLFEEPEIKFAPTYKFDTSKIAKRNVRQDKAKASEPSTKEIARPRATLDLSQDPENGEFDSFSQISDPVPGFQTTGPIIQSPKPTETDLEDFPIRDVDAGNRTKSTVTDTATSSLTNLTIDEPGLDSSLEINDKASPSSALGSLASGKAPSSRCYDSSSKRRIPAWCDRILYHGLQTSRASVLESVAETHGDLESAQKLAKGEVKCLFYTSISSDFGARSDHQPVIGGYMVGV